MSVVNCMGCVIVCDGDGEPGQTRVCPKCDTSWSWSPARGFRPGTWWGMVSEPKPDVAAPIDPPVNAENWVMAAVSDYGAGGVRLAGLVNRAPFPEEVTIRAVRSLITDGLMRTTPISVLDHDTVLRCGGSGRHCPGCVAVTSDGGDRGEPRTCPGCGVTWRWAKVSDGDPGTWYQMSDRPALSALSRSVAQLSTGVATMRTELEAVKELATRQARPGNRELLAAVARQVGVSTSRLAADLRRCPPDVAALLGAPVSGTGPSNFDSGR